MKTHFVRCFGRGEAQTWKGTTWELTPGEQWAEEIDRILSEKGKIIGISCGGSNLREWYTIFYKPKQVTP